MRDIRELKIRPRRRNPFPLATAAAIADFEKRFDVRLPADFTEFLMRANGGIPTLNVYDDPRGGTGAVDKFYGLGDPEAPASDRGWDFGNLWAETRVRRPWIGDRGIPFSCDGGDNQLFLDCSQDPTPVCYLNASTRRTAVLFPTFASFLDALRLPGDDDL